MKNISIKLCHVAYSQVFYCLTLITVSLSQGKFTKGWAKFEKVSTRAIWYFTAPFNPFKNISVLLILSARFGYVEQHWFSNEWQILSRLLSIDNYILNLLYETSNFETIVFHNQTSNIYPLYHLYLTRCIRISKKLFSMAKVDKLPEKRGIKQVQF